MKAYALAVAFIGACLCLGLFTFWRIHMVEDEGFKLLSHRTEEVTHGWEMAKVPISKRILTFVLADRRFGSDPFTPPKEPGWLEKPLGKLSYAILPQKKAGKGWTPLGEVYKPPAATSAQASTGTATVNWDYDGLLADDEERMARAIADVLKMVQAAQGQSNVVAQGMAAGAAIEAIKSIPYLQARGGRPLVNKAVCIGGASARNMSGAALSLGNFQRPSNLSQMVSISWTADPFGMGQQQLKIDLYTSQLRGRSVPAHFVAPAASAHPRADPQALAAVVKEIVTRPEDAQQVLSEKERAAGEKTRMWKNHDGFYFERGTSMTVLPGAPPPQDPPLIAFPGAPPPQAAQDSLSFVTGGGEYAPRATEPGKAVPQSDASAGASDKAGSAERTVPAPQSAATYVPAAAELVAPVDFKATMKKLRGHSEQ